VAASYFEDWTDEEMQQAFADAIAQYEQEGNAAGARAVRTWPWSWV